ncbi:unnamed protein product, partial [Meganyctiphanes norvegica]
KRNTYELYQYCCWAYIIAELLVKNNKFFVNEFGESLASSEADIIFLGSVVLKHILGISANSIGLEELQVNISNPQQDSFKHQKIGSGLFPVFSLFNHSCNPSTQFFTYGNMGIFRAIRMIPAGSEVSFSYGMSYFHKNVTERISNLQSYYHFTCTCEACENDWKVINSDNNIYELPKLHYTPPSFQTKMVDIEVLPFGAHYREMIEIRLKELVKRFYDSMDNLHHQTVDLGSCVDTLIEVIDFFDRFVILPDITYVRAQAHLVKYYK